MPWGKAKVRVKEENVGIAAVRDTYRHSAPLLKARERGKGYHSKGEGRGGVVKDPRLGKRASTLWKERKKAAKSRT